MIEGWLGSNRWCEAPEGYFGGWGFPQRSVGSKLQVGLPTRGRKGTQITFSCEKQQDFCLPGRDGQKCREPLKGPKHKIPFAATYPGLQQREGRVDWRCVKRVWVWCLQGENGRNSHQDPCAESFPILQSPSFSGRALLSKCHQPERKQQL